MDPDHNQLDCNDDDDDDKEGCYDDNSYDDDDDDDLNRVVLATAGPSWVAELVQV